MLWGVAEHAWPRLVPRIAAEAEILHVARLAAAPSCARILRLYGHQPLAYSVLEGKCGFVRGRAPALVVVARFDALPLLPVEDAATDGVINRAADARAVALKAALVEMIDFCEAGEFVKANDAYILVAIGNSAWPIGVTSVGIHTRTARENVEQKNVAHVMNNEMQRKYLTSVKRLMKFAQDQRPDVAPSKKVT